MTPPSAAKKKASKRRGKGGGKSSVAEEDRPVRSMEQVDAIISRANEKAPQWAEAWRMQAMGVPSRVIGQRMGVSHTIALEYARNWLQLVDGDPGRVSERAEIVAHLDLMTEKMLAELTRLEAAQARFPQEERAPVWLANSDPLLKVLAQKARLVAPHSKPQQVTVEMAAQAGGSGVPEALGAVIARVTISDSDAA